MNTGYGACGQPTGFAFSVEDIARQLTIESIIRYVDEYGRIPYTCREAKNSIEHSALFVYLVMKHGPDSEAILREAWGRERGGC